jgi:trimeric autotransporter adhesin
VAIALRAAQGSNNAGGATTITMTVPSGVQDGDVMVMCITYRVSGSWNPTSSGWVDLIGSGVGTPGDVARSKIFWRVASSEPASYAVNIGGSTSLKASGTIIALSGANSTQPVAAQFSYSSNTSSATVTAAALGTWASINGIDLFMGGTATGTTAGSPTNYTQPANGESASTGGSAGSRTTSGVAYRSLSAVTTVGSLTAVYGAAAENVGLHVFIKEVSAPLTLDPMAAGIVPFART